MKKLMVAAVAATMASASMADISIKGDAYLQYADNGIVQSGSNTSNRIEITRFNIDRTHFSSNIELM
jgi:hypothetical protein